MPEEHVPLCWYSTLGLNRNPSLRRRLGVRVGSHVIITGIAWNDPSWGPQDDRGDTPAVFGRVGRVTSISTALLRAEVAGQEYIVTDIAGPCSPDQVQRRHGVFPPALAQRLPSWPPKPSPKLRAARRRALTRVITFEGRK